MRLGSFEVGSPTGTVRRVGVVDGDQLLDVTAGYAALLDQRGVQSPSAVARTEAPPDMQAFLEMGERAFDAAREVRQSVADDLSDATSGSAEDPDGPEALPDTAPDGAELRYDRDSVRLLSPVPHPNSLRDFMAFEEHVANSLDGEVPDVWYERPVYYKGNRHAIAHPGEDVAWPRYTEKLDYELELAAVIGREGRNVDADDAEDYVAGYTIFNDFSARDVQMREMEGRLGPAKGKDFANGFGPYLVAADAIQLEDATMRATVNGEVWSEGTPGEMYHSFPEIIEYVSQDETLYPGDVLGSGTVGRGCGLELDRWLEPGDTIELSVEGIGTLEHTVVEQED